MAEEYEIVMDELDEDTCWRLLARAGVGRVAFVREGDRVRFDVNVTEAQRAGLTISSRLLRVARRVSPAGTEP